MNTQNNNVNTAAFESTERWVMACPDRSKGTGISRKERQLCL